MNVILQIGYFLKIIFITLMLDFIILRCSGWMESMLYYHCATLVQVECRNLKELEELSSCPLGPHQQSNGAMGTSINYVTGSGVGGG